MRAKLISRERGEFAIGRDATIGRSAGSTVTLEASVVSSEHARIEFDDERGAYVLEDLGSLNGTYLDGVRLDRKEVLGNLHVIRFGDEESFIFQLLDADPGVDPGAGPVVDGETVGMPASDAPTGKTQIGGEVPVLPASLREGGDRSEDTGRTRIEQDAVPVPAALAEASEAVRARAGSVSGLALEFALEGGALRFPLRSGDNVVGRTKKANVRLDFPDLSRRHATVTVAGGSVRVRDEGSRNRTFVNGEAISTEVLVPVGAKIVFGRLEARLIATEAEEGAAESGNPKEDPQ